MMNSQILSRRARRNWFHFAALYLLLLMAHTDAFNADAPLRSVTVAYYPLDATGIPVVRMVVGEQHISADVIVDIGSTNCIISSTLAHKLGLSPEPAFGKNGKRVHVNGEEANSVELAEGKIGDLTVHGQFIVIDSKRLNAAARHPIDGIIGVNILAALGLQIATRVHQITFYYPASFYDAQVKDMGFADGATVTFTRSADDQLLYTTLLFTNGTKTALVNVLIDTGSNRTKITQKAAQKLGLVAIGEIKSSASLFGVEAESAAKVDAMSLGEATAHNLQIYYPKRDSSLTGPLLGMDVLSHFDILFDFSHQKMYLVPSVPAAVQVKPVGPAVGPKP